MLKLILRSVVCIVVLAGSLTFAQAPPTTAVPLVVQITPAAATPGSANLTLTMAGANFSQNATVTLTRVGVGSVQSSSATVNASGTQIVATFSSSAITASQGTLQVTVTNVSGAISNSVSLPLTYATSSIGVSSNLGFPLGSSSTGVVAGDFNGDGNVDFASIDQIANAVTILVGNGNGTFAQRISYPTGNKPWAIAAGDFNGDGKLDLAISNAKDDTLTILLGNGDGTFTPSSSTPATGAFPGQIVVADFNGDGKLDLAVANVCGTNPTMCFPQAGPVGPSMLTILLGNGDGTFAPTATSPATGNQPSHIAVGDFNGDGFIDLAVTNTGDNNVTIFMGNGDGTFTPTANSLAAGTPPGGIVAADFNGDGALDLAVLSESENSMTIYLNQGCSTLAAANCTFSATQAPVPVGSSPTSVAAADMNGDGILDIVTANWTDGSITVLLGNGSGGFSAVVPQNPQSLSGIPYAGFLFLADLNGDGRQDIVAIGTNGGYSVVLQSPVAGMVLTSSNGSVSPFGQQVTFIATISGVSGFPLPTGTVTFNDGNTSLGIVPINANQAYFQTSNLNVGTHQITASYSGDSNYVASASNVLTQTVLQVQSTTSLISNPNPSGSGQAVALIATVHGPYGGTATGTVNFMDLNTSTNLGTVTLSNNSAQAVVSNLSIGSHQIAAFYSGDANFSSSGSPVATQTVNQATTTLSLSSSLSSSSYSQAVTLTATVQPSYASGITTGTVSFYDNGNFWQNAPVLSSAAQITITGSAVGTHSFTATYFGDTNFSGSSAPAISVTVTPAATTTTVTSSANPSVYGQSVTYTGAVKVVGFAGSNPSGAITFYDGTTVLSSGFLSNGSSQFTVSSALAGAHSVTAQYGGTANFAASTSAALTQTVTQAPTTLLVGANPNPSSFGQSVSVSATIQSTYNLLSNGGTVTFYDNGTQIGSGVVQGNASVFINLTTIGVGARNITAKYSGDANLGVSTGSFTQTVNPAATTTYIASSSYTPGFGQSITLSSTIKPTFGNTPTGTVTFVDQNYINGTNTITTLGTATVTNNAASFSISTLAPGNHFINAQYSGDTGDAAGSSLQTEVVVSPPATTTVLTSSVNPSSYNQSVTLTATLQLTSSGTPTGTVTFYSGSQSIGTSGVSNSSAQLTISSLNLGTQSLTATYSGDRNFSGSTSTALSQVVNTAATTTTVASNNNPSIVGQNVTFTVVVTPAFGGTAVGLVTLYDGSTAISNAGLSNNTVQFSLSTLTVGTHSITAKYQGNTPFAASTSTVLTQTVNLPATSTYLTALYNTDFYGQTVTLNANIQVPGSGTATGTVTILDGTTSLGTATVANNAAQLAVSTLTVGSHPLTAQYSGNSSYAGSTSAVDTVTINQASTTAMVGSSTNPAAFNQSVTFSATVAPAYGGAATGTFTFFDGSTSLGTASVSNNAAQLTVSTLSVGSHSITAKYSGDANLTTSTSAVLTQTVNPAATTTTLVSNLNPSTYGQSVSMTATVQPPSGSSATGTVTFLDGTTSLGTATLTNNTAQLTLASLAGGTHSITAAYGGNSTLGGSTSSVVSQVVSLASTTTAVTSSANPSTAGQSVTLTVAVQPASGGTASGSVTFLDGTTNLGAASLSNNAAQLSVPALSAGSHSITAKFNGDSNTSASTSAVLTQTVTQASTTTVIMADINPATYGQTITLTVTVTPSSGGTPTGMITVVDSTTNRAIGYLTGNGTVQFSLTGMFAGVHSLTAVYAGDTNFAGSTSTVLNETINPAATSTVVSSSLNPAAYGQAVTFTATVQPPAGNTASGTVTFMDGSASLGSASLSSNSAQLTLFSLTAAAHSITAVYAGSTNLSGSTSAALTETVNGASTTTTVSSSANPSTFGQATTLSATVQPGFGGNATGTITFLDGTTSLGSSSVSGNAAQLALSSLAPGSHSITAKYSGDANFGGSTSSALTQTVNQASTTSTVTSSLNPATFGQSVTFTVKVQSTPSGTPTGTVTLMDGATPLGSSALPANGVAQFTVSSLSLGSHSITAPYNGDANFSGSTSSALTQTINQASTTSTVTSSLNPATFGQSVTFTVKVQSTPSGTPTGTVALMDGATSLGSSALPANGIAQFTVSSLSLGSHSITASYGGDANFSGSTSAALAQVVNQGSTTTSLSSNINPSSYGQSVTFTASIVPSSGGAATGTVTFLDGGVQIGTAAVSSNVARLTTAAAALNAGSHSITATYSGDANFGVSNSTALSQVVNAAATTTTLASNLDPSISGQTVVFTATVSSAVSGTQSGTVSFYLDGSTTPAQSSALSGGTATFSTSSLSSGSHTVSAAFVSSNSNFKGSSSAVLTQNVKDFSISAFPASRTIARSSSGTYTLTLTPIAGFTGSVSLSCSGAPTNTTCSVSPSQVTLNGTSSVQTTVTVTVNRHATVGTDTLTLKGTSGSVTQSVTVSLNIN